MAFMPPNHSNPGSQGGKYKGTPKLGAVGGGNGGYTKQPPSRAELLRKLRKRAGISRAELKGNKKLNTLAGSLGVGQGPNRTLAKGGALQEQLQALRHSGGINPKGRKFASKAKKRFGPPYKGRYTGPTYGGSSSYGNAGGNGPRPSGGKTSGDWRSGRF